MENPNLIAGWELGAVGTHSKPPGDEEDRNLNLWLDDACDSDCYSVFCDYRTKRQYGCGNCTSDRRYVFLRVVVGVDPHLRNPCQIL